LIFKLILFIITHFSGNNPGPLMVLFNSDDIYRQNEAGFAFTYVVS